MNKNTQTEQTPHTPDCSSLPDSKASKYLGTCYCDCGADKSATDWKLWEEIDGTTQIFPIDIDPDDLSFGRAKPICIIPQSTPFKFAKLIAAAPELLAALKQIRDSEQSNTLAHKTG